MKTTAIKRFVLISKIVTPILISLIVVYLFQKLDFFKYNSFYFTVSSFGIIITLFNLKKIRYNIIINLISSISLSFVVLFLSLLIGGGFIHLNEKLLILFNLDHISSIVIKEPVNIISVTVLSPILMFRSYRLLFQIKKNKYFKIVTVVSILILLLLRLTEVIKFDDYLFVFWQSIMILALQIILYKNEVIELF